MDDHHRNSESESPESLNSGDILSQLKEKIKLQAQRIRFLENYKLLCEERLIELCPTHTLPVHPEHIGSGGPSISQEILNSRQKIAKLEQQLSQTAELVPSPSNSVTYNKLHELYTLLHQKFNSTVKEKNELEETLRNEVIASEEQRAYIEVLKQAIEIRVEALGLKGLKPEEFAEFSQMRISVDESRRETSRITTRVSDYESQIRSLTESLKIKTEEWAEASNDRDILTEQLHQAAEALQFAEEEVQKLEEEKMSLIEYVDRQTKIEEKLNTENKELKTKVGSLQEENRKIGKNLNGANDENRKIFEELETVKNEYNRNDKMLKDTQQSFVNLKARAEEKDRSIQKYKEENNNLSIQNTGLQAENITLSDNLVKVEQDLRVTKSLLENLQSEDERVKENLVQVKNSAQTLQEEKLRLEKASFEAHHRLQDLTKDTEDLTVKFNASQKSLQAVSVDLENLKSQLRIAGDKEEASNHLLQEVKKQSQKFQAELENLVKVQQATSQELRTSRGENEETKSRLILLNKEKESIEGKLREYSSMLDSESQNLRLVQNENQDLVYKIEELSKSCALANETCQDTEDQWKIAQREIENLSEMLQRTHQDLEDEKYQRVGQYEELSRVKNENERARREIMAAKEYLDLACRAAKGISSHLSPLNSAGFKDSALSFCDKGNEGSLHRWIESLIKELSETTERYTETLQSQDALKHKNSLLQRDYEKLSSDNLALKNKEILVRNQVEANSKENVVVRESFKAQLGTLQQEIITLRNTMSGLYEEIDSLSSKNRQLHGEVVQLKSKLSTSEQTFVNAEKKFKILQGEKEHLERMMNKSPIRNNI